MGTVQCVAENDIQQLLSNSVNLEVAPVTGTAQVRVEYLHRADSVDAAALLQCVITTGTFPSFLWSFNGSTIPLGANSPTLIQNDQFLVLTHINPGNFGYYSCRAKDSFDSNSSWVESEDVLVEMTALTTHFRTSPTTTYELADLEAIPIEVIVVAFYCFLFASIVGGVCCVYCNTPTEPESVLTDKNHDVCSHEHINHENHHAMPETTRQPHVEEMETVFMEVEV
ncbi:hypothetical protein QTP86_030153 [Hemibagrus guttatus]|nr:hypothetical protein QTP86_030153 [Hemibagrus guttatus]